MEPSRLVLKNSSGNISITPVFLLEQDLIRVGREANADLSIQSPFISRNHALIKRENDTYTIQDEGSKNGTFVNGTRIGSAPVTLHPNDVIAFSPTIEYIFSEKEILETQSVKFSLNTYGVTIDEKTEDVYIDGTMIKPKFGHNEYLFIKKLSDEPDRIHSYDEIIKYIYPETNDGNPYVRPIYMKYIQTIKNDIQKKIRKNGINREVVKSRTNEGYHLVKPE